MAAEHEYCTIDDEYVTPYTNHLYQGLQQPTHPQQNTSNVQQMDASVDESKKMACKKPPCWGWAVIIIGIGLAVALGAAVPVLLMTNKTGSDGILDNVSTQDPTGVPSTGDTGEGSSIIVNPSTKAPPPSYQCVIDVAILIHNYHPNDDDWLKLLNFVTGVMQNFTIGRQTTRVALITVSERAEVVHKFGHKQERGFIEAKIWAMDPSFSKRFDAVDGFRLVHTYIFNTMEGDRGNVPNVLIIITAENPQLWASSTVRREIRELQLIATVIHVALPDEANDETLSSFASNLQSSFQVQSYSMLNDVSGNVMSVACEHGTPEV